MFVPPRVLRHGLLGSRGRLREAGDGFSEPIILSAPQGLRRKRLFDIRVRASNRAAVGGGTATGATLLARSVANLYAVDPGVRIEGVAVVDVVFGSGLNRARREQALGELTTALRELPGVQSVGTVQQLPLRGGGYRLELRVDEHPDIEGMATEYRVVTPGYLESIGIGLRLISMSSGRL